MGYSMIDQAISALIKQEKKKLVDDIVAALENEEYVKKIDPDRRWAARFVRGAFK